MTERAQLAGLAAFVLGAVLGTYVLGGGAWFFAGWGWGYLTCLWVAFAKGDTA